MTTSDSCALSCYQEIGTLNAAHHVTLVQHSPSGTVYVKKDLTVYNAEIYRYLQKHPVRGTPEIAEAVEEDGHLFVIEEYISGQTLRSILDNGNVFSEDDAVKITEQLCRIVQELHNAVPPILHRDIKPSNIMQVPDGSIRLLDMNAARRADPEKREDTELIGTVGYAAPEQFGFDSTSVQTDIYAIGVLLCELVTGALPKQKMPRGRLGRIVRRCTRLDPKDRYRSVDDLLDVLASCHSPSAVSAGSQSSRTGRRSVRRFILPGYRTGSPVNILIATCAYAALLWLGLTYTAEGIPPGIILWTERLIYLLFGFGILLFTGNYRGIWTTLRIDRVRNPLLRLLVVLIVDALLAAAMIFVMIFAAVAMGAYTSTLLQGR